jgi:transcriptional regulator with XRE-family HTH domain
MTPVPSADYLERFRRALRLEIKAEMGRQSLSPHALAQRLGGNPQYVNQRILTPSKKTGRFVDISVSDLTAIAGALDVDPADLMRSAVEAATSDDDAAESTAANLPTLADKRRERTYPGVMLEAAREDEKRKPRMGED